MADHRGKQVGSDKLEVVASFCYLGDMQFVIGVKVFKILVIYLKFYIYVFPWAI